MTQKITINSLQILIPKQHHPNGMQTIGNRVP